MSRKCLVQLYFRNTCLDKVLSSALSSRSYNLRTTLLQRLYVLSRLIMESAFLGMFHGLYPRRSTWESASAVSHRVELKRVPQLSFTKVCLSLESTFIVMFPKTSNMKCFDSLNVLWPYWAL